MSTSYRAAASQDGPARGSRRVRIGRAAIDDVTLVEAVESIVDLVARRRGGFVCTPNVDHVVLLEDDVRLRGAYERASLVLADGMPIVWASRLLGAPLREKVSGSDLMEPLLLRAAEERWRVYLVGGGEGVAERAAARLKTEAPGLEIVGIDPRRIDLDRGSEELAPLVAGIVAARPDLVLVALGCPKQEIVMDRIARSVRPAVCAGIGAGLDFVAGTIPRAPRWISAAGLEWLYRLAREPRRLWRRYLVRDPRFAAIVAREMVGRRLAR